MSSLQSSPAERPDAAGSRWIRRGRIALWAVIALVLVFPAVAMRFTNSVDWNGGDFAMAALVLGSFGISLELVVRAGGRPAHKWLAVLALLLALMLTWVNLAVGILGADGAVINRWAYVPAALLAILPLFLLRRS